MIIKYNEFINESLLEFILEANIQIEPELLDVLTSLKSPLANELRNLNDTEVNVNTNYITFDVNKDDRVMFRPDDKVSKAPFILRPRASQSYLQTISTLTQVQLREKFGIKGDASYSNPEGNVEIVEINQAELKKIIQSTNTWMKHEVLRMIEEKREIVILTWKNLFILAEKSNVERNISTVKQSEIAIGRFTRAILKKADIKFSDKEIEEFVNEYKTAIRIKKESFKNFDIVEGEAIKHWYLAENYETENGTLGNSCMRYNKCSKFLNIYSMNKDQVKLIILKSTKKEDKLCGRALLWTDIKDRKFMDRIYTNDSSHEQLFKEYAIAHGYYYKLNQCSGEEPIVYNRIELSDDESIVEVELDDAIFEYYPYMDTLKYLSNNTLTSNSDSDYEHCLEDTEGGNGSCDCCGGQGEMECSNCDGTAEVNCHRCDGDGDVECEECDGNGTHDCEECDGDGERECPTCDGFGKYDCPTCEGTATDESGDNHCPDCEGNGQLNCSDCNDGMQKCKSCDNGKVDCDYCSSGRINCSTCDGDGTCECDDCRNGIRECPECS